MMGVCLRLLGVGSVASSNGSLVMEREHSEAYAEIYRVHEDLLVEIIRDRPLPGGWKAILHVGCGDGLLFERLAKFGSLEGVEPDAAILSHRFRDRIFAMSLDENFRPGKLYSLILLFDVLEHRPDPAIGLRHVLSLLARNGRNILTLRALQILWTNQDVLDHHRCRYSRQSFRALAWRCNFEVQDEPYLFPTLVPVKLFVWVIEKLGCFPAHVPSVPARWLNHDLYRFPLLDLKLAMNAYLSFGNSLLVSRARRAQLSSDESYAGSFPRFTAIARDGGALPQGLCS